jgi:hypothetical protein
MFQAIKMQQLVDLQAFTGSMTQLNDAIKCGLDEDAVGPVVPVPESPLREQGPPRRRAREQAPL